jgi:hypothetical protein
MEQQTAVAEGIVDDRSMRVLELFVSLAALAMAVVLTGIR